MSKLISVCMIVKNEADRLDRCLTSIKEVADELIIVDTGSTDDSPEICRRYGANVHLYEWKDDFAAARNYGLPFATGEWILWLDADEVFEVSKTYLHQCLKNTHADILSIPVINYYGEDEPVNPNNAFVLSQYRLYRKDIQLKFIHNIHEQLDMNESHKVENLLESEICIHHFGYLNSSVKYKEKSLRNLAILQKNLSETEQDPWLYFHIANELQTLKAYEMSFNFINGSILGFLKSGQKPPAILYRLKYDLLINSHNYDEAWSGIDKVIELYPDYVDLHYLKGQILFAKGDYKESMKAFKHCLKLGEDHPHYLILKGTGSFRASDKIKQCHEKINLNG